jgi:hypothetical protein
VCGADVCGAGGEKRIAVIPPLLTALPCFS